MIHLPLMRHQAPSPTIARTSANLPRKLVAPGGASGKPEGRPADSGRRSTSSTEGRRGQFRLSGASATREAGGMSIVPENAPVVAPGPLVVVDDPEDPRLDLYRDLNDPAGRPRLHDEKPVLVVEGRLAVERLLTSKYPVHSLLVDDHQVKTASALVTATRARGARWPRAGTSSRTGTCAPAAPRPASSRGPPRAPWPPGPAVPPRVPGRTRSPPGRLASGTVRGPGRAGPAGPRRSR